MELSFIEYLCSKKDREDIVNKIYQNINWNISNIEIKQYFKTSANNVPILAKKIYDNDLSKITTKEIKIISWLTDILKSGNKMNEIRDINIVDLHYIHGSDEYNYYKAQLNDNIMMKDKQDVENFDKLNFRQDFILRRVLQEIGKYKRPVYLEDEKYVNSFNYENEVVYIVKEIKQMIDKGITKKDVKEHESIIVKRVFENLERKEVQDIIPQVIDEIIERENEIRVTMGALKMNLRAFSLIDSEKSIKDISVALHKEMMEDVYGQTTGLKTKDNSYKDIHGNKVKTASAREVNLKMELLDYTYKEYINADEEDKFNKLSETLRTLYQIHPHQDGNTRTTMAIMNFCLLREGYHPIRFNNSEQGFFMDMIRKEEDGAMDKDKEWMLTNLIKSKQTEEYLDAITFDNGVEIKDNEDNRELE